MRRDILKGCLISVWIIFILSGTSLSAFGESGRFALNSQATVLSGDFGAPKNIAIISFNKSLKYIGKRGEIGVSLPYLIRNGGGITSEEAALVNGNTIPNHADGIGDVSLRGRYYWLKEDKGRPAVDLTAKVKFPTASHTRGLGTGEFDFGGGASLFKPFSKFVGVFDAELLGRKRPEGSNLKSMRFDYSVGVGYSFTRRLSGFFFVDGSTKSSSGDKIPVELVAAGAYKLRRSLSLNGFLLVGLTDGSPDLGGSTGITAYF